VQSRLVGTFIAATLQSRIVDVASVPGAAVFGKIEDKVQQFAYYERLSNTPKGGSTTSGNAQMKDCVPCIVRHQMMNVGSRVQHSVDAKSSTHDNGRNFYDHVIIEW
jgi:hypothetical protein